MGRRGHEKLCRPQESGPHADGRGWTKTQYSHQRILHRGFVYLTRDPQASNMPENGVPLGGTYASAFR